MDEFFCKRVDNLFATIFSDAELSCKWWWKRCKYKKRGKVHTDECFCLDCDLDIIKSAEIGLKTCMVEFSIDNYGGWGFTTGEKLVS